MATELEIMSHAKNYIDQMANGINPLTGQPVEESDLVNNVRISRCLFYVSDVLRQVIEKGGLQKKAAPRKPPFTLTDEQIAGYQQYDIPLPITAFTARINALTDTTHTQKLSFRAIQTYLKNQGYLEERPGKEPGKTQLWPTESGQALGIYTEDRNGSYGDYTVVLYDVNAQKYVIDHLAEIIRG
ncbi:MAG: hypothetical protein IJ088_06345 [Clostridia bacterium]|nr:hypothetical protein [Clostridia bacterium]